MRVAVVATAICLSVVGLSAAGDSKAAIRKDTSVPAGGLGPALQTLAKTYDFQVLYRTEVVGDLRTQGAAGTMTALEALKQVLSGTGLSFKYLDENTVTIIPITTSTAPLLSAQSGEGAAPTQDANGQQKEGKKSSFSGFLLAQVAQGAPASSTAVEKKPERVSDNRLVQLEEVIVTAQKREERLQDVPVPVTAISADRLVNGNQLRLQDYYTQIPGLSVQPSDARGASVLAIRGISSGDNANPTVGVTVDDVPYGSSTFSGGGWITPDIDPSDLTRVEVLRGPQGTLYGASSLGGLIRYVTADPSTDGVSGRVQSGITDVYNGAQTGYSVRASVNVPLNDTFAVRASAFTRLDPGYIDNVGSISGGSGQRGVNWGESDGGRLAVLWRPSESFSITLAALLQDSNRHGSPYVYDLPGLGDLQQSSLANTGTYDKKLQAYSAKLSAKWGGVDLTAVSGLGINSGNFFLDFSPIYSPFAENLYQVAGAPINNLLKTDKFTQEIRLSAPIGRSFEWLIGAFYAHESSRYAINNAYASDPATGQLVGTLYYYNEPTTYKEYAGFADLTVHLTDRFDVQLGGRESKIEQTNSAVTTGPLFGGATIVTPETDSQSSAFTYLVTPRFKVSQDVMVYARLASGYRPGGPNSNYVALGVPSHYDPDTTHNYDLGAKADVLDGTLSIDASLYYIDWNHIQVTLEIPAKAASYLANGGRAKSQGAELAIESRPVRGLTVAGWVAFSDAVLTESFPTTSSLQGVSGDRLPFSSRFSGNVSLEQDFRITTAVTGFVGGTVSYVGDRVGNFTGAGFTPSTHRQSYPSYAEANLRGGWKSDTWTVNVFVNNVADKRAALMGGVDAFPTYAFDYIEPRTVGLSASKTF
jgi:iron complex outermembrane receptor protein